MARKRNRGANRRARMLRLNPRCFYCNRKLRLSEATIDHFIPLSKGGSRRKENERLACIDCNASKADKSFKDWIRPIR